MFSCYDLFLSLFLYRYIRLIVNLVAFCSLRPIPVPEVPRLTSRDVTVVIPSLHGDGEDLVETIRSILVTEPFEIVLVTIHANLQRAQDMVNKMKTTRIRICSIEHPNKRRQMIHAIPQVRTEITIFADDDVTWPRKLLPWMLAPLEDKRYGGVGTNQRLRRADAPCLSQRLWGYLGALYLERRNFDCAACMFMDGGLPCLSGRTVAYRTDILTDKAFLHEFDNEIWLGQYHLNADDDNFITRWLVSHGKDIAYQYHKEAEIQTTLETNSKFLKQCLRWSRSNWRSNITSMFRDRHIWRNQPWSTYAVHLTTLTQWAFLCDCMLVYLYLMGSTEWDLQLRIIGFGLLISWMFTSKFIKLMGHYIRYPSDLLLLPVSISFGYFHSLVIKVYALLSLNVTAWGSRDGADDDDSSRMKPLSAMVQLREKSRLNESYALPLLHDASSEKFLTSSLACR